MDPNPDTVEEFRVLENNYTAEYGRSGGGIVTRSDQVGHESICTEVFSITCEMTPSMPMTFSIILPGSPVRF